MESGVIQKTIVAFVLIVLAFIAGSMVAESRAGSLIFVGAVASVAFVVMLGRRCWWLIFLAPPLLNLVPLGIVQRMPVGFAVGGAVMMYWIMLSMIGAVRMKWRSLPVMDFVVALVFLLFVYSYICHPVIMGYFADFDETVVGGQEYLWCAFACIYYISLSLIPCSKSELERVLRWSLWLVVVFSVLSTLQSVSQSSVSALAESAATKRFALFSGVGMVMVLITICRYRIIEILLSPVRMGILVAGALMVLMCGFRETFVMMVCVMLFVAAIRREFVSVSALAALMYGAVLLLSSTEVIKDMPFGIQRSLSIIPGVEVDRAVERETRHSSSWRVVMWKWALDPRTGYIRDYVWGDGFGVDMAEDARSMRSQYRGTSNDPQLNKRFARTGTWHNGPITAIHRVGIVGLCVLSLFILCSLCIVARACHAYQGQRVQFYYLYFLAPIAGGVAVFYLSAGTIPGVFGLMTQAALGKVVYCIAREEGVLKPLFSRKIYVPLIQRPQREQGLGAVRGDGLR